MTAGLLQRYADHMPGSAACELCSCKILLYDNRDASRRALAAIQPTSRPLRIIGHLMSRIGRNDSCPCGSGRKYKQCCGAGANADAARRARGAEPGMRDTYNNLGNAHRQQGNLEHAIACYRTALQMDHGYAISHYNLGDTLAESGRLEEAIACLRMAAGLAPQFIDAHLNLGNALLDAGRTGEAIASYQRVLRIDPRNADAHLNLGNALRLQGRTGEAIGHYREAVDCAPTLVAAHANLGNALLERHDTAGAGVAFRRVLELDPEHGTARHVLDAISGMQSERAPVAYVAQLFDNYAATFDAHLLGHLNYVTPQRLAALVAESAAPAPRSLDVLDLGCGTGLAGAELTPFARSMTGVDVSAGMLEIARSRGIYHRLEQADLCEMMNGESRASYDLVVAADVFVYLGRLDGPAAAARALLRDRGLFAFSVEALEAREGACLDYGLNQTGRYAHSSAYLDRLAAAHGFAVLALQQFDVRADHGRPIRAWLALWSASA